MSPSRTDDDKTTIHVDDEIAPLFMSQIYDDILDGGIYDIRDKDPPLPSDSSGTSLFWDSHRCWEIQTFSLLQPMLRDMLVWYFVLFFIPPFPVFSWGVYTAIIGRSFRIFTLPLPNARTFCVFLERTVTHDCRNVLLTSWSIFILL